MITINHSFIIEIDVLDTNAAVKEGGFLLRLASRVPLFRTHVDRKIKSRIEAEIRKLLKPANVQHLIQQALLHRGVHARVRVS